MGTSLTGLTPATTYDALIKVGDNGPLSATAKYLSDGLGNDSVLALSTSKVFVNTTTSHGTLTIEQPVSEVGLVVNSSTASAPTLYLRDAGGAGYSEILANNKLYINSVNVGIGTTTPTTTLDVAGTGRYKSSVADYLLTIENIKDDSQGLLVRATDNDSVPILKLQSSVGATSQTWIDRFVVNKDGNVGIGTATPTVKLDIEGASGSEQFRVGNTSGGTDFGITVTENGTVVLNSAEAGTSRDLVIQTGGVERARFSLNGLSFNGDTAAANALDDYEEGTWTIGISFGGGSTGITYTNNTGTYTKIGRQVTVNGYLLLSSKGSSTGAAKITGLPFTNGASASNLSSASLFLRSVTFANQYTSYLDSNSSAIDLFEATELGAVSTLTNADFSNSSEIGVSLTYFV